jgi:hypothetical protein
LNKTNGQTRCLKNLKRHFFWDEGSSTIHMYSLRPIKSIVGKACPPHKYVSRATLSMERREYFVLLCASFLSEVSKAARLRFSKRNIFIRNSSNNEMSTSAIVALYIGLFIDNGKHVRYHFWCMQGHGGTYGPSTQPISTPSLLSPLAHIHEYAGGV